MPLPPKNPEDFDKINYVIDSWSTGCDAPWYIYIETMKPAALEAFIVLISFGWADVIRGRFRPKGLGRRTGKRKGKWAKRIPRFPEIGNTLGKSLPFGEQVQDFVKWGSNTKFLWRIDNAVQATLFFWLVADVAEDFVFNWTSLLYKSYWCLPDPLNRFSWHDVGLAVTGSGPWRRFHYRVMDYQTGLPGWNGSSGASGPTGCSVAATCTFKKYHAFPQPTVTGVRVSALYGGQVFAQTGPEDASPDGLTTLVAQGSIPPNTSFVVHVMHEPNWAEVGEGVVMGVATEAQ